MVSDCVEVEEVKRHGEVMHLLLHLLPSFLNCLPISYTLSIPPTTNILWYSSGATLMKRSISRSLWCVMKGLAEAPPGIMFIRGVSTSRKPRLSKNRRIYVMILALCMGRVCTTGCSSVRKSYFRSGSNVSATTLPDNELVSDLLVHDEIQVPLSEACLFVLQAIVQVG